jgi:cystathionine beta-lyase
MQQATYDFDTVIDRRGTGSLKFDFAAERGKPADALPLWVADMDFAAAPPIVAALERAARFGIYGYTETKADYFEAVAGWQARHFGWRPEAEWLVKTPGVVFALAACVRALTEPGDGVLIQQPVYYPFSEVIADNGRRMVNNSLRLTDGRYAIDFADFETKAADPGVKLFLLCSPHNPTGRVWTAEELARMGAICRKHGVVVVSDEIHSDFVWRGRHRVFADAAGDDRCIICTAPSKSFNLAGLQVSNIFIPDAGLREKFKRAVAAAGYSQLGQPGLVACKAAYTEGEDWLNACKAYIAANIDYFEAYLQAHLPALRLIRPEGTYLLWVDFRGLGLTPAALEDFIVNRAKLWLDAGAIFGKDGAGFERFNAACPRATLTRALDQLAAAVQTLR